MAGSALCGAAPEMNAFIVGCVLVSVGGNGVYLDVVCQIDDKERPMYLGLW